MRKTFNASHDQAVANDAGPVGYTPDQMCAEKDCPNRWALAGSMRCSAHHWAEPHLRPLVTQEQRNADTDTMLERQNAPPHDAPKMASADKRAILAKVRALYTAAAGSPKAWAHALQGREKRGEQLGEFQRACWRNAIRDATGDQITAEEDERTQRLKADTNRRVIDYARKFGISLDEAQTLLDGGRGSRAPAFAGHQARAEAGLMGSRRAV